jgi:hypothetical protein
LPPRSGLALTGRRSTTPRESPLQSGPVPAVRASPGFRRCEKRVPGAERDRREGRSADQLLDRWLELGKERFASRAANRVDPRRALDYLQGAGAAVLLIEVAYPAIAQLGERKRSIGDPAGPELGIFEHSAAALDRLDGAFAVLDASMLDLGALDGISGGGGF